MYAIFTEAAHEVHCRHLCLRSVPLECIVTSNEAWFLDPVWKISTRIKERNACARRPFSSTARTMCCCAVQGQADATWIFTGWYDLHGNPSSEY